MWLSGAVSIAVVLGQRVCAQSLPGYRMHCHDSQDIFVVRQWLCQVLSVSCSSELAAAADSHHDTDQSA